MRKYNFRTPALAKINSIEAMGLPKTASRIGAMSDFGLLLFAKNLPDFTDFFLNFPFKIFSYTFGFQFATPDYSSDGGLDLPTLAL